MCARRLPFRALFTRVGQGWKRQRDGHAMAWRRCMKKLASVLSWDMAQEMWIAFGLRRCDSNVLSPVLNLCFVKKNSGESKDVCGENLPLIILPPLCLSPM